jgi:hypothetical protein
MLPPWVRGWRGSCFSLAAVRTRRVHLTPRPDDLSVTRVPRRLTARRDCACRSQVPDLSVPAPARSTPTAPLVPAGHALNQRRSRLRCAAAWRLRTSRSVATGSTTTATARRTTAESATAAPFLKTIRRTAASATERAVATRFVCAELARAQRARMRRARIAARTFGPAEITVEGVVSPAVSGRSARRDAASVRSPG